MQVFRPSQIYILSNAGISFTSGFYFAGYAAFLWQFLAQSGAEASTGGAWFAAILGAKFFFEFVFDVGSSLSCDVSQSLSRRSIFLLGTALQALAFAALAGFFLALEVQVLFVALLLLADILRSAGNGFISGTLDGWAVTQERAMDPHFNPQEMFARALFFERMCLLFGGVLTVVAMVINAKSGTQSSLSEPWIWVLLWASAAIIQAAVCIVTLIITSKFPSISELTNATPAGHPPRVSEVIRSAFDPRAMLVWFVLSCLYLLGALTTYTWPALIGPLLKTLPMGSAYAIPLFILLAGTLGAWSSVGKYTAPFSHAAVQSMRMALCIALAGAVILLTITAPLSEILRNSFLICGAVSVLGGRYFLASAYPAVMALVHEHIGANERVRSAVVSFRVGVPNFLVALAMFFASFVGRQSRNPDDTSLGIGVAVCGASVVVLVLVQLVRSQRSLTTGS